MKLHELVEAKLEGSEFDDAFDELEFYKDIINKQSKIPYQVQKLGTSNVYNLGPKVWSMAAPAMSIDNDQISTQLEDSDKPWVVVRRKDHESFAYYSRFGTGLEAFKAFRKQLKIYEAENEAP